MHFVSLIVLASFAVQPWMLDASVAKNSGFLSRLQEDQQTNRTLQESEEQNYCSLEDTTAIRTCGSNSGCFNEIASEVGNCIAKYCLQELTALYLTKPICTGVLSCFQNELETLADNQLTTNKTEDMIEQCVDASQVREATFPLEAALDNDNASSYDSASFDNDNDKDDHNDNADDHSHENNDVELSYGHDFPISSQASNETMEAMVSTALARCRNCRALRRCVRRNRCTETGCVKRFCALLWVGNCRPSVCWYR